MSIYDKASLVLIPSGTKTSKVYSQVPTNGDGDFTFSRSTAATRVNASGNIEKEIANFVLQSNTFSSGTWIKQQSGGTTPVLTSGFTDPNGGSNAWRLQCSISGGLYSMISQGLSTTGLNCNSIWIKSNTGSNQDVYFRINNADQSTTRTATTTWQRIEVFTDAVGQSFTLGVRSAATGATSSCDVLIYAAQTNQGLVAQDVITTTTTAIYGGITDNVPRLDYTDSSCPALLLEPQRSNVVENSEYSAGLILVNVSRTQNSAISPEGVQNATTIASSTSAGPHYFGYNQISVTSGTSYSASLFVKKGTGRYFQLLFGSSGFGTTQYANFDLQDGVITYEATNADAEIVDYGNGWYRCSITSAASANTTETYYGAVINSATAGRVFGHTDSLDYYIYGAQYEVGSYATSYIPTYGSAVTRNTDSYYNNNMASLYDSANGFCLYFEYADVKRGDNAFFDYFSFQQLPNTDTGFRAEAAGANNLEWRIYTDNIDSDLGFPMRVSNIESKSKVLMKVETTGIKLFADGSLEDSQSGYVVIPTLGTLQPSRSTAQPALTQIKQSLGQILYLPVLSDEECIDLTTI